jgi:DNA helicase II / ATP-dependent DNA helicase PcrA
MEFSVQSEEYLAFLNDSQKEAVLHDGPSLLILAGAGSGKTRVITTKIAYLIQKKNYRPSQILAVTFTKKAAREMQERAVLLEEKAAYAQIRTFHSFGAYFLRLYAESAGISPDFTVYDDDDMVTLLSKAVPSLTKKQAAEYAHKISLAKDYCLLPQDFEDADNFYVQQLDVDSSFANVYCEYQKKLKNTGNVDFGDLIMLPYLVLKNNKEIAQSIHYRYRVILVDEYQDSNVAQFLLLQELSGLKENSGTYVCVVGDDDQSIYKFRGAEVQNILNFQKYFPGTQIVRLEKNYRSTSEILSCADSVVKNNQNRLGKTLVSVRGKGKTPTLVFLPSQDDETQFCADMIKQSHEKGVPYSDWAILYRMNAQSMGFESEFLRQQIPYSVVGSLKFYEREEIKDALSWLDFIANSRDEIAFRRIVNKPPRGIGETSQDKIIAASPQGSSILEGLKYVKLSKKVAEGAENFSKINESLLALLPPGVDEENNFLLLSQMALNNEVKIKNADKKNTLASFIEEVINKTGLVEFHRAQDEVSGTQKVSNLEELVNSAVLYPCTKKGLLDFLDHIQLDRTLESESETLENTDKVTLITLHNTKGLEFSRVIITGLEYGVFPREDKSGEELEEERRLFYVGITRAKDQLYFTSCGLRRLYGQTKFMMPSVFLGELDSKNIRILGNVPAGFSKNTESLSGQRQCSDPLRKKYKKGVAVYHDDYGHGYIISAYTTQEGEYAVKVSFETGGIKTFLPKYQYSSLIIEE